MQGRYRNPEDDLPTDFTDQRTTYYQALNQPLDPKTFIADLQHQMQQALETLDAGMPTNPGVKILQRPKGWLQVSKLDRLPEPLNLAQLKMEITQRWPMASLLDVLKETDLRVGLVMSQKWRWTEIDVTLGLILTASTRKEWPMPTCIAVRCPHCHSDQIVKRGATARGTQRYLCQNTLCAKESFLLDYCNRGCVPAVKDLIIDMSLNASGVRDTARSLHISTNTVLP